MKKIFTIFLLLAAARMMGQQYNNEWINFSQTYYKFKVGVSGLYRIPQSTIVNAGLGSAQVEYLQLWRNGKQVPFYSTVASGTLGASDYLEFWGEANDGKPDRPLYRDTNYQHTDKISLETDTAMFFLTVSANPNPVRFTQIGNDVASNTLPVEPYLWYTTANYYRTRINAGVAAVVGEYVYSSSYDKGEYFSTADILPSTPNIDTKNNLHVYAAGPDAILRWGASGNALNPRHVRVSVNGTLMTDTVMDYFNDVRSSSVIPLGLIAGGTSSVQFVNTASVGSDRMVVSFYEISYPRRFLFNLQKNFPFELPAKAQGYYLEITQFDAGAGVPVMYDLTNNNRIVANVSGGTYRFVIPPLSTTSQFVMVSQDPSNIIPVNAVTAKNFINFSDTTYQADYLIISNPLLYNGTNGNNPVVDYRNYRRSTNGGGFNAKIVDINELVDQFAFGIKKHPLSIRNFLAWARANFVTPPKFAFLIGHGLTYVDHRRNESNPISDQLNLVPTFGFPGSDNKLGADDAVTSLSSTPIGRLSVVHPFEIENYLEKVIEYEDVQRTSPQTIAARSWMKNIMHVTGASDPYLGSVLCNYMTSYKAIIEDTLVGGRVYTFCKTSPNPVEQLSNERVAELFEEGLSMLTYFGHSSSTTLEFNIDNPQNYNNQGKYPVFFVNGCNAGNFFAFDPVRFTFNESLSEKFTLAKQRGAIAFVASTHYGIVNYLNIYVSNLYLAMSNEEYGKSLGELNQKAMERLINVAGQDDYYARLHAEEITLNGDPALKLNFQIQPDYIVEEPEILISPAFVSIAESEFKVKARLINIGKAIDDSVSVEVKRQYPDGTIGSIYKVKQKGIHSSDSLIIDVPIIATRDKGLNKIIVTVDVDNDISEVSETNNSATKEIFIYEDEAKPIYPYNFSIIRNAQQKFYASTADPFSLSKQYVMEIDTTKLFNSSLKRQVTITSPGGLLEFNPNITLVDSTVYFWRTALVPSPGNQHRWNNFSFKYMAGTEVGFNQSNFYQHLESGFNRISIDSASRMWEFGDRSNELIVRDGVFPTAANQADHISVTVNGVTNISSVCGISNVIFNVLDPVTLVPWLNAFPSDPPKFGSDPVCGNSRRWNFQFTITDTNKRRKIVEFLDMIPNGHYVVLRNTSGVNPLSNTYASTWKGDTSFLGSNNSMYHRLLQQGFTTIDSFYTPRAFIFVYRKNDPSFTPKATFSQGIYDRIQLNFDVFTPDTVGSVSSPVFGPAKQWKQLQWQGTNTELIPTDKVNLDVVGVDTNSVETVLFSIDQNTTTLDLSLVNPSQYPYIKLKMTAVDTVNLTPFQLKYWRLLYDPVPEGAIAPNMFFIGKDTLEIGEKFDFGVAFKNISEQQFDSLKLKLYVLDKNNVPHYFNLPKAKPLVSGDTVKVMYQIDSKDYAGLNTLYFEVNPDADQPEQYHFNNFLFHNIYVKPDTKNPLLDVTFDGVHILNRDIVSAKPKIQIKLKDDAKFLLLNDTSLTTIQIRYPDIAGTLRTFNFDGDTLKFIPATNGANNTATIEFGPYFPEILGPDGNPLNPDGDEYELIVKGKDRSDNKAGSIEYRVTFKVINKAMVSNLLNYPNPFTTSTAFVFTITGSEVPQNMKIQILTVTGKIVREITKEELGPIHIGRNITEFKWDGTDQFGQKLANGVYLYRFVTTLNGKRLDKYKAEGDNTDKFFNKGYGKMYLMR